MKKEHIILASLGVAALGAFLLLNKKNEDVVEEQAEPTSQPVYVKLDKDLILKRGMQGYEVKELQRLLGLSKSDQDGVFGGGTETALLNKKALNQ
jgi:peptidoglycan hydrolase-like protein with peptidoglycan-binding domain